MPAAVILALLAAAAMQAQYLLVADLDRWNDWSRVVEQARPWLVGGIAVLAACVPRWAVILYAVMSVWGVQMLAPVIPVLAVRADIALLSGAAGLLLLAAGMYGAAASAPAEPRRRAPVVALVSAWVAVGLWLLAVVLYFTDDYLGASRARVPALLSHVVDAVLFLVLVSALRRGTSRWVGGAFLGMGVWALSVQTYLLQSLASAGSTVVDDLDRLLPGPLSALFSCAAGVSVLLSCGPVRGLPPRNPSRAACDDTTRALCAAMHLDRKIPRNVAYEVVDRAARGIAPSWGVDAGLVIRHCLWAVRRQALRDVALAVTAGMALTAWLTGIAPGAASAEWIIAAIVLAPPMIIAVERWAAGRAARNLRRGRECLLPRLGDEDEAVARAVEAAEAGNITPFDGYFPFAGSGTETGGWSFALALPEPTAGGTGEQATSLRPKDLYDEICHGLDRLAIDGLTFDDRLYVDTDEVPPGSPLWTADDVPALRIQASEEELHQFVENPMLHHRVYRCVRVSGWNGEYVLSLFVNIERRAGNLFVSARYFLLRPVEPRYAAMVRGGDADDDTWWPSITLAEVRDALVLYVASIPSTVFWVRRTARSQPGAGQPRVAAPSAAHHIAAGQRSLRELAQGPRFRRYFQQLDWDMTTKLLEREVLAGLARALRARGVDTAELEKRQTAILNYGVIVNGGEFKAENLAVGKNAQSRLSRIVSAAMVREEDTPR